MIHQLTLYLKLALRAWNCAFNLIFSIYQFELQLSYLKI